MTIALQTYPNFDRKAERPHVYADCGNQIWFFIMLSFQG